MNRPAMYQKSIDALVQAYFNDTLVHTNCMACAVGNLVAHANGAVVKRRNEQLVQWETDNEIIFNMSDVPQNLRWWNGVLSSRDPTISDGYGTGYTLKELSQIESAFEDRGTGSRDRNWEMFESLMRVVSVLDRIHEVEDETISTASKERFHAKV